MEMAYSYFPEEAEGGTNNLAEALVSRPRSELRASQTRNNSAANLAATSL